MKFIATTGYSLEGVLNREIKSLGMNVLDVSTSRVMFEGDHMDGCRASIMLRSAGRILLQVGEFTAVTFDELFDGTYNIQWERIVEEGVSAAVDARSVNSALFSQRTIQSIVQKAIFQRRLNGPHLLPEKKLFLAFVHFIPGLILYPALNRENFNLLAQQSAQAAQPGNRIEGLQQTLDILQFKAHVSGD